MLGACLLLATAALSTTPARAATPVEPYADYVAADHCAPAAKAGTHELAGWLSRRYGGDTSTSRECRRDRDVSSEHQEGRAVDLRLDATTRQGRESARELLDRLFATDRLGNPHALARRMGIMYLIWDDHMYGAWDEFRPEAYLSGSCRSRRSCSATLRHRDHVHVSLSRRGARARTSWYLQRS